MNYRPALKRNLGILKSRADVAILMGAITSHDPFLSGDQINMVLPECLISGGCQLLTPEKADNFK